MTAITFISRQFNVNLRLKVVVGQRLVETDAATASAMESSRRATPRRRLHSGAVNIPAFEEFDLRVQVVTLQVQHDSHQSVSRVPL